MGAGVSAGETNDDLVDNLVEAEYIKHPMHERVLRAVDRGAYFLNSEHHVNPYRDVAWKDGMYHISAPCIYSTVLDGLMVQPGHSFLNLGSGTGYFSTVVGLLLGSSGINHGVELNPSLVEYAYKKIEEFKYLSGAIDEFDFCEPKFMAGNVLHCTTNGFLYDRVYCGSACPEPFLNCIKNFVKPGGILMCPINDQLIEMKKTLDSQWTSRSLLPVSFATLVLPHEDASDITQLFEIEPTSLQELCRATIRQILRSAVVAEQPDAQTTDMKKKKKKRKEPKKRSRQPRLSARGGGDDLFKYLIQSVAYQKSMFQSAMRTEESDGTVEEAESESSLSPSEAMEHVNMNASTSSSADSSTTSDTEETSPTEPLTRVKDIFVQIMENMPRTEDGRLDEPTTSQRSDICKTETVEAVIEAMPPDEKTEDTCTKPSTYMRVADDEKDDGKRKEEAISGSSSAPEAKRRNNRDKLDSGLGDDLISETSGADSNDRMLEASSSSSDSSDDEAPITRSHPEDLDEIYTSDPAGADDNEEEHVEVGIERRMHKTPMTQLMQEKITELPLPFILKRYLNYYRDF